MEASALMDAHVQAKRIYSLLNEVLDLTRQLAEAVDRNDQVSIAMLVSMREEPMKKLRAARQALEQQRDALSREDARRLCQLLDGEGAGCPEEAGLANQVGINQRLLKQVLDLDQAVSRKLAREQSFYHRHNGTGS